MRRFLMLALLGAVTLATWDTASSAGWRRGHRRCRQFCRCQDACTAWCGETAAVEEPLPPGIVARQTFTSPKGRSYQVYITSVREPDEAPRPAARPGARLERAPALKSATGGETFNGSDRRAAKLSISSAANENFSSLDDLLNTLPSDDAIAQDPNMSESPDSTRVAREDRNVTVSAFIYASSKESDNDFHCILGTGGPAGGRSYINAEISGLPDQGEPFRDQLLAARQAFKDYLGAQTPGHGYQVWRSGIPVRVSGSLFFDVHHYLQGNQAGTGIYKAQTYWEIHPITNIEFEP